MTAGLNTDGVADHRLERSIARVMEEVAGGDTCTGAQLYVSRHGTTVANLAIGSDGLGRPITCSTRFNLYCASKPLIAMAIGVLVDELELSFIDRLCNVLDDPLPRRVGQVTIGQLLDHTAGVHQTTALAALMWPLSSRWERTRKLDVAPGWAVGRDAAYAEFAHWELLARSVEALTGIDHRTYVRDRVLGPMGLRDSVVFGTSAEADIEPLLETIGVNVAMHYTYGPVPLLVERTERCIRESPAGFGAYASMSSLGRLYEQLAAAIDGTETVVSRETLRALTTTQRSRRWDDSMKRDCAWGYGFMTDLADHAYGKRCSPYSFGHSGQAGASFAMCDPVYGVVVAVLFNGVIDSETAVDFRRPMLMASIYRELDIVP